VAPSSSVWSLSAMPSRRLRSSLARRCLRSLVLDFVHSAGTRRRLYGARGNAERDETGREAPYRCSTGGTHLGATVTYRLWR
jgi:hypothetical protein